MRMTRGEVRALLYKKRLYNGREREREREEKKDGEWLLSIGRDWTHTHVSIGGGSVSMHGTRVREEG